MLPGEVTTVAQDTARVATGDADPVPTPRRPVLRR